MNATSHIRQSLDKGVLTAGHQALQDALRVSFRLLRWAIVVLVVLYLVSGFFIVSQHEKALVLQFGRLAGEPKEAGPHWTWPRPFSEVVRVPTEEVQTLEVDDFWYFDPNRGTLESVGKDNHRSGGNVLNPRRDGYTITGDANLLHTRWVVRYTIMDPVAYCFAVQDVKEVIRNELRHAVVRTSARYSVDRAWRTDLASFRDDIGVMTRKQCMDLNFGVKVDSVEVEVSPPLQVVDAFDLVTGSDLVRNQLIDDARAYEVRTQNIAEGEKAKIEAEAETKKQAFLSDIRSQADTFSKILPQYLENPQVIRERMILESIFRILPKLDDKYVLDESSDIRLWLSPKMKNPLESERSE